MPQEKVYASKTKGFSLLEVLIAMTISSILLLSTSRFYRGYSGVFYCNPGNGSWKMRCGNACLRWVNSSSEQDTVQGIVRGKG